MASVKDIIINRKQKKRLSIYTLSEYTQQDKKCCLFLCFDLDMQTVAGVLVAPLAESPLHLQSSLCLLELELELECVI